MHPPTMSQWCLPLEELNTHQPPLGPQTDLSVAVCLWRGTSTFNPISRKIVNLANILANIKSCADSSHLPSATQSNRDKRSLDPFHSMTHNILPVNSDGKKELSNSTTPSAAILPHQMKSSVYYCIVLPALFNTTNVLHQCVHQFPPNVLTFHEPIVSCVIIFVAQMTNCQIWHQQHSSWHDPKLHPILN